jgi:hypothetical protein
MLKNLTPLLKRENMPNKASAAIAMTTGMATFLNYLPAVMGALASLAAIIWICIQAYYFIKEKKK